MSLGFTLHRDAAWLGIHRSWGSSKVLDDFWTHRRKGDELWRESAVGVRWLWVMGRKCPAKQNSSSAWSWGKISACEGEMPMQEISQEATGAVVPQSSLCNFLQLHFPYKMSLKENSSLSQTFHLWKVFSYASFCSFLLTPHIPATLLVFLRSVSICHVPSDVSRLFPSIPAAVGEGWCQPSQSISAQKGSEFPPATAQPPAQPVHEAPAAARCSSLPGFLKGKTCQLWKEDSTTMETSLSWRELPGFQGIRSAPQPEWFNGVIIS